MLHHPMNKLVIFAHFEEGDLVENECNVAGNESILDSIDESYTDEDSGDGYISTNCLEDIRYRNYIHLDINARDARLKVHDSIIKS